MSVVKLNFDEICRLCLRTDEYITFIFNEMYLHDSVSLAERIYKISTIKICIDDGLPLSICSGCKKKVDESYEFQEQIIETESILRKCVKLDLARSSDNTNDIESIGKRSGSTSLSDNENTDFKLVCVEADGTQVFTIDEDSIKLEDSVEIVPIYKRKQTDSYKQTQNVIDDNAVVVYSNKSFQNNKGVPLKLLSLLKPNSSKTNVLVEKSHLDIVAIPLNLENAEAEIGDTYAKTLSIYENNDRSIDKEIIESENHVDEGVTNDDKSKTFRNGNKKAKFEPNIKRPIKSENCEVSCQLCLQQFGKYDDLQTHISKHFDGFHMLEAITDEPSDNDGDDADESPTKQPNCGYCLRKIDAVHLNDHITKEHSDGKFACRHCIEKFNEEQEMKEHVKSHHYTLQCNICATTFDSYLQFQGHLSAMHYKGSFWCPPCSKSFTQKYDFILHQRRHLGIRPFKCKYCSKQFVTATLCKEHERRHTKDAPYLCKFCGKSYVRISELKNHEKTVHITNGPITCQVCSKVFSNLPSYKLHSKRHELGLRFICNTCGKAYYSNSELQRHEQIHSGLRRFPCNLCENSFMSQPELNRHLKYHNGEKKYKCTECGKCYYESGHLRIHERSHTGIKPYECQICFKRFVARPKLMRHLKIHDQNKLPKIPLEFVDSTHELNTTTVFLTEESSEYDNNSKHKKPVDDDQLDTSSNKHCEELLHHTAKTHSEMLANIVEIEDYNQVINMDNVIVDDAGNMFEMQMSDGNIVIMENGETLVNDSELIYTSIQDNVKIEIIDS